MADINRARREAAMDAILAGRLTVGLARDRRVTEETDAAYERQPVTFVDAGVPGDVVRANEAIVRFPRYAADAAEDVRHWVIMAGEELVLIEDLERPIRAVRGEELAFDPGELRVAFPNGGSV